MKRYRTNKALEVRTLDAQCQDISGIWNELNRKAFRFPGCAICSLVVQLDARADWSRG